MSHHRDFHARLKDNNRELLDELAKEYGVLSAAAALNRLLDKVRAERTAKPQAAKVGA